MGIKKNEFFSLNKSPTGFSPHQRLIKSNLHTIMLCVAIRQIYSSTEDWGFIQDVTLLRSKGKRQVIYIQHLKYELYKCKGECLVNITNLQYSKHESWVVCAWHSTLVDLLKVRMKSKLIPIFTLLALAMNN